VWYDHFTCFFVMAGVCAVFAWAAAASLACEHHLAGLRARVGASCSQQLDAIDPLRVHFSQHDLGEYEACQAELRAFLAFNSVQELLSLAVVGRHPKPSCGRP